MERCQYYGGTEKISDTKTKIKCRMMEDGGRIFENKDPEGAMIAHCCWKGGEGCPVLNVEPEQMTIDTPAPDSSEDTPDIDPREAEALESLADEFALRDVCCPHYKNGGSCIAKPLFGSLEFSCGMVEHLTFTEYNKAAAWLSNCALTPEACSFCGTVQAASEQVPPSSDSRQEKALKLHRQITANSKIAAECMVAMGRDLKVIRDEKLYTEFGCADFAEYCEAQVGIGKRHGYNFIQVYERFGEEQLAQLQGLGITKLLEIAKLDDEDVTDLISGGDAAEMSVRQLKEKIEEYQRRCEQLTLDLTELQSKETPSEAEALKAELDSLKAQLRTAIREKEDAERRTLEEIGSASDVYDENARLREEIAALKNAPPAPAAEISEEEKEALRKEGRDEANKYSAEALKSKTQRYEKELEKAQKDATEQRIIAVEAARKQEAAKFSAEIRRLEAKNAELQALAQTSQDIPAPPPDGDKEKLKFFIGEIERAYNLAMEVIAAAPEEDRAKYKAAMLRALDMMREDISG